MRFRLIDAAKEEVPLPEPVQGPRGEPKRLLRLEEPPRVSAPARGPGAARPCPLGLPALEGDLRQPAQDARAAGSGPERWAAPDGPAEARERAQGSAEAAHQAPHRQPSCRPGRAQPPRPGLLGRAPRREGGAEISSVWTREGWLDLAVVIDLFARRVVGWAVSDRLHKELALTALRRALAIRRPPAGLTHPSDSQSVLASCSWAA